MKSRFRFKSLFRELSLQFMYLLPARFVLRGLLNIENWIYYLVGKVATHANGGVHPKHRFLKYHGFFINHIQHGDKVLDIGCGNGVVALDIAQKTEAKVTGIDSDATKIAEAITRGKGSLVKFVVGDVLENLPEESFDVVILSNVLEHLPDRIGFLLRLVSSAHPSRLLIRVPLFDRDWQVALKRELGVEWRLDPTHFIEYTLETFTAKVQSAHLAILLLEVRWGEIWAVTVPLETIKDHNSWHQKIQS